MNKKIALILAGGKGTRLWPISRDNYPKQFVEFKDGLSLFQLTLKRLLSSFSAANILILSSQAYKYTICNQIQLIKGLSSVIKNTLKNNLVLEPCSKSTAPAILLALKFLEEGKKYKDVNIIYVFPSDHSIEPLGKFKTAIEKARNLAQDDYLVCFGVKPTSSKEGYGYILTKERIGCGFKIDKFVEKPNLTKINALIKKGAFWNAGIFCFKREIFLAELAKYKPQIHKFYTLDYQDLVKKFKAIPKDSIDYAVMQKTKKAAVVEFDLEWSDLGSWDSYFDYHCKGKDNYSNGEAEFINSHSCLVYSGRRLVSLLGMKDVLVVDSPDALLLVKKGASDQVRDLVSVVSKKYPNLIKEGMTVYRPWGYYTVLQEAKNYKVKEIGIYPQKSISLQKHKYRSEHWNLVAGEATTIIAGQTKKVKRNESLFVPKNCKHKVYNHTNKLTKLIEVQIGDYLGEDDIQRYDSYDLILKKVGMRKRRLG